MSPEQAKSKAVDKRADIWAFGVVLYEMLTGKLLFGGETVSDILASVIKEEPDWGKIPAKVHPLLRRCLEKDPKRRLRDIGDAMPLSEVIAESATAKRSWLAWGVATVIFIAFALLAFMHFREVPPQVQVLSSYVLPPDKTVFAFEGNRGLPALSPDGRHLVFAATTEDGKSQLWIRPLDSLGAQPLLGTEGATLPFWSPDSRFVGFFADGKLKRIDIAAGSPFTLTNAPEGRGGAWSPEGVIVFAPSTIGALQRVSDGGGDPSPAAIVDESRSDSHRAPWFLPDGKHFIYAARRREQTSGHGHMFLYVASLDSKESRMIGEADSNAEYSEGCLLFLRENSLMAQPFDAKRLVTTGDAAPIAERVKHIFDPSSIGMFSVSAQGLLAYQSGATTGGQKLTWFDRAGKPEATVGDAADFPAIALSPDGKSLAAIIVDPRTGTTDIWTYDLARGFPSRFTFDPYLQRNLVWSPDGRSIVFDSNRKGSSGLYRKSSSAAGSEEMLHEDTGESIVSSISHDGKFLLLDSISDQKSGRDLWILPLSGDPKPHQLLKTPFTERFGQFSPDGRWIAYMSNESQQSEIYVVPFRAGEGATGGKRQISTAGGSLPRWRADGKEIYYIGLDGKLMAAEVNTKGDNLEIGTVRPLFGPLPANRGYPYDISEDGQRILAVTMPGLKTGEPLTLVQNWAAGLKK
jgi:Tol biopolymer transport system component